MDPDYLKTASKDWRRSRCIPAAPPKKCRNLYLQLRNLGLPPGIRRIPRKKCCLIFMFGSLSLAGGDLSQTFQV